MTNLANMPPLGLKGAKAKRNPAYLDAVRGLRCVICDEFEEPQLSPTTAHHPIHDRFAQRKVPDEMAIPLCEGHHQGLWDDSKVAVHKHPAMWKRLYGADHDYIARTQDVLAHLAATPRGKE